jgi:ribonucleoside-diphosphate reductase alpha chain
MPLTPADMTPLPASGIVVRLPTPLARGDRERLPRKRRSETYTAAVGGHKVHVSIGCNAVGKPLEVWVDLHREGAPFRGALHLIAESTSQALQYGVPLAEVIKTLASHKFDPSGDVEGHDTITHVDSVPHFVALLLAEYQR